MMATLCSHHSYRGRARQLLHHSRTQGCSLMQLAPSLHQIGSDIVNCYLVEEGGLVTIIDAGLPGHWRELLDELRRMGHSLDDVRALLLTHGDTDHIGFAARLHRERGVPVYVHPLDAPRARGEVKKTANWGRVKLRPVA